MPNPANPQSFNRYSYVLNNPIFYADPSGNIPCDSANLQGMDQGACVNDTQQAINNNDSYYPSASRVANAIIGAGFGDTLPAEYAQYDNSATWDSYFRNAAGLISEPVDWFLTGKEIFFGEVGFTEGAGMVLFAVLPIAQGGWGDEAATIVARGGDDITTVYRGLPEGHPQLATFNETGIVKPWGGHDNLERHVNLNDTKSNFTSWSLDRSVAESSAQGGTVLSVDYMKIPNESHPSYVWSDFPWEKEITITGPVNGASVVGP